MSGGILHSWGKWLPHTEDATGQEGARNIIIGTHLTHRPTVNVIDAFRVQCDPVVISRELNLNYIIRLN